MKSTPDPPDRAVPSLPERFPTGRAARLLGMSGDRIRAYARAGFLKPERGDRGEYRLSFQDLAWLKSVSELSHDLPGRRLAAALRRIRRQLPPGRDLTGLRFNLRGGRLVVHDGGTSWDVDSGQTEIPLGCLDPASVQSLVPGRVMGHSAPIPESGPVENSIEEEYAAGCALEAENPEAARESYRRVLELDPDHSEARTNLGRLLHEAGELGQAECQYRKALEACPENVTAAFNLGVLLEDQDRPLDAVLLYRRALELSPGHADAHFNLSRLCERLGRREEAIRHLQIYRDLIEE